MPSCFESLNNDPPSSFSYLIGVRIYETYCSPYIRYSKPKNTKPTADTVGFVFCGVRFIRLGRLLIRPSETE